MKIEWQIKFDVVRERVTVKRIQDGRIRSITFSKGIFIDIAERLMSQDDEDRGVIEAHKNT